MGRRGEGEREVTPPPFIVASQWDGGMVGWWDSGITHLFGEQRRAFKHVQILQREGGNVRGSAVGEGPRRTEL